MSYIIDQIKESTFWAYEHSKRPHLKQRTQLLQGYSLQSRKQVLLNSLGKTRKSVMVLSVGRGEMTLGVQVSEHLLVLLKIDIDSRRRVFFSLRLLTPEGQPLVIRTRERRLIFYKLISVRLVACTFQEFKIMVSTANGEVLLHSVGYHLGESSPNILQRLFQYIILSLSHNLEGWNFNIIKEMCSESSKYFQKGVAQHMEDVRIAKLHYNSQFLNVFINLAIDPTNEERSLVKKQMQQIEAVAALKNNFVSPDLRSGLVLYSPYDLGKLRSEIQGFYINVIERDEIIAKTAFPKMPPARKGEVQVNYVVNHIKLAKRMEQVELRQINNGGFSTIYETELQYQYVGSYGQPGQPGDVMKGVPPQRSQIVVKRDLPNGKTSRVAHQKLILKNIKSGMSRFLPKYYIVSDALSPFANDLLMECIRHPTLCEYLMERRESLALQSKLYLAVMIAQALRYLQDYRIAHLDLKPENVMLFRELTIKLIDFGDAFHPDVKRAHRQGFTAPYSAPENYFSPQSYTHKNDVFSLGIILHEFLFGRPPFQIYDEKLRNDAYMKRRVHDYWWCVPEESLNFGEATTFPVLQLLISKCLSPNPSERPQLQWIVFTLRNCIGILWS